MSWSQVDGDITEEHLSITCLTVIEIPITLTCHLVVCPLLTCHLMADLLLICHPEAGSPLSYMNHQKHLLTKCKEKDVWS